MFQFLPPLAQLIVLLLALVLLLGAVIARWRSGDLEVLDADEARRYIRRSFIGGALLCLPFVVLVTANLSTVNALAVLLPVAGFYAGWAAYWGLHRWFLFLGQGLAEGEGLRKLMYFFLLVALGPMFGVLYGVPGGGFYEYFKCRRALRA